MSVEANKALVRRFYAEVISAGNLARVEEFIGPDYIDHNAEGSGCGPDVVRAHVEALRRTFPDFGLRIDEILGEGDKIVTRVSGRGTHSGAWIGIRPTGAVVQVKGINIDRVADQRILEHWGEADTIGMLRQMGVDPFAD
ncbi:ester cyclase [Dongia deserti]|uniref:ester cyclase n=1 Tax=Dongia deserti TaxID=2268030 RepID=UPI000E64C7F1|nr:ester cyclase [Dongia deserti]